MPALLPHPLPHVRVVTLTETVVKEHDRVHSDAAWLGIELVVEREARHAMEAWTKVFRQKGIEVEEAHRAVEGMVTELRASLILIETSRDAACRCRK